MFYEQANKSKWDYFKVTDEVLLELLNSEAWTSSIRENFKANAPPYTTTQHLSEKSADCPFKVTLNISGWMCWKMMQCVNSNRSLRHGESFWEHVCSVREELDHGAAEKESVMCFHSRSETLRVLAVSRGFLWNMEGKHDTAGLNCLQVFRIEEASWGGCYWRNAA